MEVGIRELKQRASELVRTVREDSQVIWITYHGKVVAKLSPAEAQSTSLETEEGWATLEQLSEEIGRAWGSGVTALEALSESRR